MSFLIPLMERESEPVYVSSSSLDSLPSSLAYVCVFVTHLYFKSIVVVLVILPIQTSSLMFLISLGGHPLFALAVPTIATFISQAHFKTRDHVKRLSSPHTYFLYP